MATQTRPRCCYNGIGETAKAEKRVNPTTHQVEWYPRGLIVCFKCKNPHDVTPEQPAYQPMRTTPEGEKQDGGPICPRCFCICSAQDSAQDSAQGSAQEGGAPPSPFHAVVVTIPHKSVRFMLSVV